MNDTDPCEDTDHVNGFSIITNNDSTRRRVVLFFQEACRGRLMWPWGGGWDVSGDSGHRVGDPCFKDWKLFPLRYLQIY